MYCNQTLVNIMDIESTKIFNFSLVVLPLSHLEYGRSWINPLRMNYWARICTSVPFMY